MSGTLDDGMLPGTDIGRHRASEPTPFDIAFHHAALRRSPRPKPTAPDEDAEPGGPIDWHNLNDNDLEPVLADLTTFLQWAIPRWAFTSEQFPFDCWWKHPDIVEDMTAWWGLWQAYIENPYAHGADPMAFSERTAALKERLDQTYRGRCRREHTTDITPTVTDPFSDEAGGGST